MSDTVLSKIIKEFCVQGIPLSRRTTKDTLLSFLLDGDNWDMLPVCLKDLVTDELLRESEADTSMELC